MTRRALRKSLLKDAKDWMFAPSIWEAEQVAEIRQLARIIVRKAPKGEMSETLLNRCCHDNCRRIAESDPKGEIQWIIGWMEQGGTYILHSVIEYRGEMMCITPTDIDLDLGDSILFIPDPALVLQGNRFFRNGQQVGVGLRPDPQKIIAQAKEVRRKLRLGIDPMKALGVYDTDEASLTG